MTTHITQSSNPRLPAPNAYTRYLDRMIEAHAATVKRQRQERIVRRLAWACWGSVVLLIAVVAWMEFSA